MNNNKGYSLTELLLAIFILSIVMLGIAGILRSTSQFYRNGVQEVRVQEEAQLAVNLIEEMLVDAKTKPTFDNDVEGGGSGVCKLSFKDETGTDVNVKYYPQSNASHPNQLTIDYDDGTPDDDEILADYVTSFVVDGIDATPADGDNKISVSVSMDNRGYKYTASKEVFMRNLVENNTISINTTLTDDDDDDTDWDYEIVLNRFDSYNVTTMCGADPTKTITKLNNFDTDYQVDTSTGCIVVKIKDAVSQAFATKTTPTYADAGLQCTMPDGTTTIKIKFTFLPVVIAADPNSDIYVHYNNDAGVNDQQGYQTYLNVQGIDINKALASGAFTGTAKVSVGSGAEYEYTMLSDQKTMANMGNIDVAQLKFAVEPAILDNGIIISCGNGAQIGSYSGTNDLNVKIILKRASDGAVYTFPVTYKFRIAGNVL